LKKKFKGVFELFKSPKLLTLTVQGHHESIKEIKSNLHKNAREFFRRTGLSGIRVVEIVHKMDGYYIHLHCIIEAKFYAQKRLSELWYSVTKTSYVVDIRRITSYGALHYILKYISKCPIGIDLNDYVNFLYKTRLLTRFGKFYDYKIEEYHDFLNCLSCGGLLHLIAIEEIYKIEKLEKKFDKKEETTYLDELIK
jgi:hypothetical protein